MPTAVRLRRSVALVLTFEGDAVVGVQYTTRARAALSALGVWLLSALADWRDPEPLFEGGAPRAAIATELLALLDLGFIVADGTPAADAERRFDQAWTWGAAAGFYHFGIKDTEFGGPQAAHQWLAEQVATTPEPPLYLENEGLPTMPLPTPSTDGVLGVMARRRSRRSFDPARPLPLTVLGDCLYAGLAIVGFGDTGVPGQQPLPLKVTPSGGARNPFEAYVAVRNVSGLLPGIYHYAGIDHSLGQLRPGVPDLAALLGKQEWFGAAAAVVLLVAYFERSSWKYAHPTGFRVVLLEAGHIAQNLLVAATAHDLAATPTAALDDRLAESLCGLDRLRHAAVHAVALGLWSGAPSQVDLHGVRPNPRLRQG